jgi:DNA polymerase III delta prime subunit
MELETADEAQKPLPKETKIIAIFDQLGEGRTLLILGEPGAGKTTTLLELTRDLVDRAEQGLDYRIPVVFNLSSWAGKKQTIADWLVEELNSKYQVPKPIGHDWVNKQELLLLLDGLDEVKAEYRDSCVAALNDFNQNYAPEMVVCSRIQDYSALSNRLNFESAIYLRSLTLEQVRHYLDRINGDLTGLRALIEGDTALQELAKSPLMLNIMVLAYEGVAVEDLPKTEVVEERRKQLFDTYIERMFHRPTRPKVEQRYSEAQSLRWLAWLAQRLVQQSQTVFFIEGMQPTWLQGKGKRIFWLGSFLMGGLILGLSYGLSYGLISGLRFGLIYGLFFVPSRAGIKTTEIMAWSWKEAKNSLIRGLILGLILGLISWLSYGLSYGLFGLLILGLMFGLMLGLFGGLFGGIKSSAIAIKTIPNQGIYRTARNAGIMGLIIGLISGLSFGLFGGLFGGLISGLMSGLMSGLVFGGGKACIQHFVLRFILYRDGYIPWNYARFLDYAAERIFLQKVGGGYIFIHRLLLEHFAQMKLQGLRKIG